MLELILDFLVELIPDSLEKFFSKLIDNNIRHRGIRSALKKMLFLVTGLLTIAIVIAFFALLIALVGIVLGN